MQTHVKIRKCDIIIRKVSKLLSFTISEVRLSTKQFLERNKHIKVFTKITVDIPHQL